MLGAVLLVSLAAIPVPQRKALAADLGSFFADVDKHCPFLKTKGIARDWEAKKKELQKRVKKCRSEADLFDLIREAGRCLRDGHFGFPNLRIEPKKTEPEFWPGVAFLPATKKRVIVLAVPKSLAGVLKPGMVVSKINGKPARRFLDERGKATWKEGGWFSSPQRATFFEYRRGLRGPRGTKFVLEWLDGKRKRKRTLRAEHEVRNWVRTYHLPQDLQRAGESAFHTQLGDVGYMWLRKMSETAEDDFAKAIAAHPQAKAWIIDLRANTGGGYASSFKDRLRKIERPIVGIIDGGTVSAGETFARDLVRHGRAKLLGATTAGASGKKRTWTSTSGNISVRYTYDSYSGLKKDIEFFGIAPHFPTEAVPEEVAAGQNSALQRALERLGHGK